MRSISLMRSRHREGLPKRRRASRRASACGMPCSTFHCSRMERWKASSSSRSRVSLSLRKKARRKSARRREIHAMTRLLGRRRPEIQDQRDCLGDLLPVLPLGLQLPASDGGEAIEARAPVVFTETPFRGDPALLLHAMERRIERAFFHTEDFVGDALDVEGYSPAVHRALLETFEHKKGQGSLEGVILCSNHLVCLP